MVNWVNRADDSQIADVVGGDFNCTPTSSLDQELENSLGPSVLQLANVAPFVTWDDLSRKPGVGETLDYIFIHRRAGIQNLQAAPGVAFAPVDQKLRLSDHLAVQSIVSFRPAQALARSAGPQLQTVLLPRGTLEKIEN